MHHQRPRRAGSPALVREISLRDIPDAVFATDLDNRITHWVESAEQLFGYTAAEAIGRPFGELLPFRMRNAADEEAFFDTVRAGRTWRGEGAVRLRDGAELWIESTVKPILVDGQVVGSVSVSRDMSVAIAAERTLAAQERFVNALLDVAGSLVIVLDASGTVVRFNAACERLSGYQATEVVGHAMWDLLIPPDERAGVKAAFAELSAGAFPNTYENHWLPREGAKRLIGWSSNCLTDERGAVTHVIGTGIDITDARRADGALRGIEAVGQLLASHGPTTAALDAVLGTLADQMGYGHLTLLVAEGDRLRVGATRGYENLLDYFPSDIGIVGRVYRTGQPAFVRDVSADPDYRADSPDVRSEIAVPLRAGTQVVGVLDIESSEDALTEGDFRLAQTVAERVGSALLLGREQQALAERARLFAGLSEFARAADAILEPERLWPVLIDALAEVFPGDVMTLTALDRADGRYRLRAIRGVDQAVLGAEVRLGDGPAGRAIQSRAFVGPNELHRDQYARALRDLIPAESLISVAVPLIRDDVVLGAISVGRASGHHPFSDVECEVLRVLGAAAALALANAQLHEEVSELAVHDGLTGLYNRRHFDAALDLILARWRRDGANPDGVAAIMFDLDHFGRFNKDHGHQAGDAVLRAFAGILRERLRSSDLVARYGGEEFVVILEGCSLARAIDVADEVRSVLEARVITGPLGQQLQARVSAGCGVLDPGEPTKEALLRVADVGLFMAKRAGRNQVVAA
jgi:diguanylate cyclase (GGDEF)-like protein/PAS domain S-box-containing protein